MFKLITSTQVQQQTFDNSQKKISKTSTSRVNLGFKIVSIDVKSTGISGKKEISAHVGEDGNPW